MSGKEVIEQQREVHICKGDRIYKSLAASDPAMAELLSEYESLGGSI